MRKIFAIFLLSFAVTAEAQNLPTCNPSLVEWFPHPHECESYVICFHGVQHVLPCAPGLHFNPTELRCMLPEDAKCHVNYLCPDEDDDDNPVFLADPVDCGVHYLCSRGTPIRRECALGLWWDAESKWCNLWDEVICDNRTIINPTNPGNRTTLPPTTTESVTTTTLRPTIESCHMRQDLFDGDKYIKSMCIINTSSNYESARQRCVTLNMNLFIIDDARTQVPFFEATTNLLRNHRGGFVWINGRRDEESNWWVYSADNIVSGPLFDGIDWVNTSSINGPTNGDCLRYSSQFGPYQAMGIACNSNSWFVCEHSMQTEQPVTTTTQDPNREPEISACRFRQDLFDGQTYIKSMCIINTSANYEAARERCVSHAMNLFIIDDARTQVPFFEATTHHLRNNRGGFVWINGRRDASSVWWVFNANNTVKGQLYDGIDWVNTSSVHGPTSGDCLRYSSQFGPYQAMGIACTASSWLTCEYSKQTEEPPTTIATTTEAPPSGPNLTVCWQRSDLVSNGNYLKSSCIVNQLHDYDSAEKMCRENRMELFVIDSAQVQSLFRNSTGQLVTSRGFMWINGRVEGDCKNWYTFDPDKSELFQGVHWVQVEDFVGRNTGECLRFTRQFTEDYYAMGVDCDGRSWAICQFEMPPTNEE